jgi:hypothetical protein
MSVLPQFSKAFLQFPAATLMVRRINGFIMMSFSLVDNFRVLRLGVEVRENTNDL